MAEVVVLPFLQKVGPTDQMNFLFLELTNQFALLPLPLLLSLNQTIQAIMALFVNHIIDHLRVTREFYLGILLN